MEQPLSVKLNVLSNTIHRKIDESVLSIVGKEHRNFTATNAKVIGYLMMNSDSDVFQKDIEEILKLRRSTVSTLLQGMEKKGFITRQSVDYDARVKKIVPTAKALSLHEEIFDMLDDFENNLVRGISQSDVQLFLEILAKMQHNLE